MRVVLLLALCGGTAAAQIPSDRGEWEAYRSLSAIAAKCDDPVLDLPSPHVIKYDREARTLVRAMMRVDPALCPGITSEAVQWLLARIGNPERADVDMELLKLGWEAAEKGRGMAPDPALADRFGRVLWLFHDQPPTLARSSEEELHAWLRDPAAIALLDARNSNNWLRTRRSLQLHSDIALTRGHPAYDPAKGATLLEDGRMLANPRTKQRLVGLLTDGVHLPADYARASRVYLSMAARETYADEAQGPLLKIGLMAAAAAKTKAEIAVALRILSTSSIDGRFDSKSVQSELLRRAGKVRKARLTPEQEEAISRALDFRIGFDLPDTAEDDPPELKPIVLSALVGPDGRVIRTELVQSSGSPTRDRIVRGAWISDGDKVDLGPTARGRFVRVELPAIDPKLTTMDVLLASHKREEDKLLARLAEARRSNHSDMEGPNLVLAEALEELARWYDGKSRYRDSEPIVRELADLYPTMRPRALAVDRLVYDAWLAKILRHQGRFDEAEEMDRRRLEREALLRASDPLSRQAPTRQKSE
jgi:hypothetical protein